ncbi:penicillin-binding protein 2 [bacterium]|nr:penicillin-binding protein 2 [bacterium]
MKKNKIYEDFSLIVKRGHITFIIIQIFLVFLLLFFWKIQILDHNKYWNKSEANRIREVSIPCQRGLILDRNGVILADNTASFKASVIRENMENSRKSYSKIAQLLEIPLEELKKRIDKYKALPQFHPLVVKDDLTLEEVSRIEARKIEMPELIIQAEPKRNYPFKTLASHVLGYLQEISKEEMESGKYEDKVMGDLIGKKGIEKQYESYLSGEKGKVLKIVDSLGRKEGEVARVEPEKGKNIVLTIDSDLQKKAEAFLEGKEGVVVAMDPEKGEILALTSFPNFNPNKFINRFTPEEWLELVQDPEYPLENRAIRGLYAPGSIFKLVIALGALDMNLITERTQFYCSGSTRIYGHPFSCWYKPGHGRVNLYEGIQNSCNIYFYQVGKRLGIKSISHYSRMLGLGSRTGIDFPGEKKGLVPSPDWKKRVKGSPWYPGETISVSIGQGPLTVTPIQVAASTSLIANRGIKVVPHLIKNIPADSWEKLDSFKKESVGLESIYFEKVIQGMWRVVNEGGTGRAARVKGFNVCGKTGSTQIMSSSKLKKLEEEGKEIKTHSWFTGFAPKNNPEIVVTVLVEYGGMGGATAAPIARELFSLYKEKYDR